MIGLREILAATGARPVGLEGGEVFECAWADSRKITPGSLFCAVRGESQDGHAYLADALERGASCVLVDEPTDLAPRLEVADVRTALFKILAQRRRHHRGPVVAVTGSIGKTTTKDLLAAILRSRAPTYKTPGNLNSDIGVPLASFGWGTDQTYAVLEMAMRMPGEIRALTEAAPPDVGIVTVIGESHLGFVGSREALARAKAELLGALPTGASAILNGDDPFTDLLALYAPRHVIRAGEGERSDVRVRVVEDRGLRGWRLSIMGLDGALIEVDVPWPGRGTRVAAALAAACATSLGLSAREIEEGFQSLDGLGGRIHIRQASGMLVIDDTYNAAPESMDAALALLARAPGNRRVAVLGDMLELGSLSVEAHLRVGRAAAASADRLLLVGEMAEVLAKGATDGGLAPERITSFPDPKALLAALKDELRNGDAILVKGSRALGLEIVVEEALRR